VELVAQLFSPQVPVLRYRSRHGPSLPGTAAARCGQQASGAFTGGAPGLRRPRATELDHCPGDHWGYAGGDRGCARVAHATRLPGRRHLGANGSIAKEEEQNMPQLERREALPEHPVPAGLAAPETWRLRVDGLVAQPLALSVSEVEALGAQT